MHRLNLLVEKVKLVNGEEQAGWGKMHIQHMLEHLVLMLKISTGKLKVNLLVDEAQIDFYKENILKDEPFSKNINNPLIGEEPSELVFKDILTAKKKFFEEYKSFVKFFENDPNIKTMHPLLGEINKEEWAKYHIKHLAHHLVQFGLHEYGESLYN